MTDTDTAPNNTVTIGDRTETISGFSGFKTIEVSATIAAIFEEVPELYEKAAEFRGRFVAVNTRSMPRAMAELRYGEDAKLVSTDAWQAAGHTLTITDEPTQNDYIAAVFPYLFKQARVRVVRLLSILLTPNSVFEEHDDGAGEVNVDEAIKEARARLMHKASGEQLIDLAKVAWAVIQHQFGDQVGDLGNLIRRAREEFTRPAPDPTTETDPETETETEPETTSSQPPSPTPTDTDPDQPPHDETTPSPTLATEEAAPEPSDEQPSSGDSPAPSDGPEAKSSTESHGSSSSRSATV